MILSKMFCGIDSDTVTALSALAAAIFTGWYVIYTHKLVKATKKAIKTTKQIFALSNRAYIGIKSLDFGNVIDGERTPMRTINYRIKNYGAIPGTVKQVTSQAKLEYEDGLKTLLTDPSPDFTSVTVNPGGKGNISISIPEPTFQNIIAGSTILSLFIRIEYFSHTQKSETVKEWDKYDKNRQSFITFDAPDPEATNIKKEGVNDPN